MKAKPFTYHIPPRRKAYDSVHISNSRYYPPGINRGGSCHRKYNSCSNVSASLPSLSIVWSLCGFGRKVSFLLALLGIIGVSGQGNCLGKVDPGDTGDSLHRNFDAAVLTGDNLNHNGDLHEGVSTGATGITYRDDTLRLSEPSRPQYKFNLDHHFGVAKSENRDLFLGLPQVTVSRPVYGAVNQSNSKHTGPTEDENVKTIHLQIVEDTTYQKRILPQGNHTDKANQIQDYYLKAHWSTHSEPEESEPYNKHITMIGFTPSNISHASGELNYRQDFQVDNGMRSVFLESAPRRRRRSVVHLYDMVVCSTGCNPLIFKGYGCYCGFLGSGLTVDGIDKLVKHISFRCCAKHDWCYHHAKCPPLLTYFVPYYWKCEHGRPECVTDFRGWKGMCGAHLCECDRQFAECLKRFPCPRSRAMCVTSPFRFWQNLLMTPAMRYRY